MTRPAPSDVPVAPKPREAALELQVSALFTAAGGAVYKCSQGYRKERGGTRMTPGLADLEIFFPAIGRLAKFEVKTTEGLRDHERLIELTLNEIPKSKARDWQRAHAQASYRRRCEATATPYGIGGMHEARELLLRLGLARQEGGAFLLTPRAPTAGRLVHPTEPVHRGARS